MVDDATLRRYEAIAPAIRQFYSAHEYAWMSDADKDTLETRECEPDA
jgi:hypothetical protein